MRRIFSPTASAACATALPTITATRLAKVPAPDGKCPVSPPATVMDSSGTPSRAAQICASVVSWPWPCEVAPMTIRTRPSPSTDTAAPS